MGCATPEDVVHSDTPECDDPMDPSYEEESLGNKQSSKPQRFRPRSARVPAQKSETPTARGSKYLKERHAHHERLRALTVDPSSTFVAKYKDQQTGRVFERRERIREAILPEEYEDYIAWREDAGEAEQKRKKQYLDRPRKEISKKQGQEGEEVWSRELDDAYQIAIRRVPPILGKKKLKVPNNHGGYNLYGRNMLISRVIFKLTGQTRLRKQISSHNQVMWNFPRKLPYARHAGSLDTGKKNSRYLRMYDTAQLVWDEENCRVTILGHGQPENSSVHQNLSQSGSFGLQALPAHSSGFNKAVMVQFVNFAMSRHAPATEDPYLKKDPEHQYTTLQSPTGARPRSLEDVQDWRSLYPALASIETSGQLQESDIVLFETTFSLGEPPRSGSRLYVTFDMDLYIEEDVHDWTMVTTFYDGRGSNQLETSRKSVKADRRGANRTQLVDMPFGSTRWVDIFTRITKQKAAMAWSEEEKIERAGHANCICAECRLLRKEAQTRIDAHEQQVNDSILQDITVTQELFAADPSGNEKRVVVIIWMARRAVPGEAATTIWRRLNPPPAESDVVPQMSPLGKQPMTLDSEIALGDRSGPSGAEQACNVALTDLNYDSDSWYMPWESNLQDVAAHSNPIDHGYEGPLQLHIVPSHMPLGHGAARGSLDSGYWSHGGPYSADSACVPADAAAAMASTHDGQIYGNSSELELWYRTTRASDIDFRSIQYCADTAGPPGSADLLSAYSHQSSQDIAAPHAAAYAQAATDPRLLDKLPHTRNAESKRGNEATNDVYQIYAPQPIYPTRRQTLSVLAAPDGPVRVSSGSIAEVGGAPGPSARIAPNRSVHDLSDDQIEALYATATDYSSCYQPLHTGLWNTECYADPSASLYAGVGAAILGQQVRAGPGFELSCARIQEAGRALGQVVGREGKVVRPETGATGVQDALAS